MTRETKICQNCKSEFVIEPDDFQFYKRMSVPAPTWCPECRAVRRLIFWNEHNLFRNKDSLTGKGLFSGWPEEAPLKIYEHDYWWSDKWNPLDYGRDYDFSRPFFEQFKELYYSVPWPSRSIRGLINSDYSDKASYLKNCYLCFNAGNGEDCAYGVAFVGMRSSFDFYCTLSSELCYELYRVNNCYQVFFSEEAADCLNSWFLVDCTDCQNCFGCVSLSHKKYHIFNTPYTKEDHEKKLKEFNLGSYQSLLKIKKEFEEFRLHFPVKYIHSTPDCVNISGDYVYWSKNARHCYEVGGVENSKFIHNTSQYVKDSYDYSNWGENVELIYESVNCGDSCHNLKFCFDCWPACRDLEYSVNCHSSSDLFGCVGLKKQQYCILNKEYSKDEYFSLREKIVRHMDEMPYISRVTSNPAGKQASNGAGKGQETREIVYKYGEFFPPEFSPLAYNETKAQDYYPLSRAAAEARGYFWREPKKREFWIAVPAVDLPDHIKDADESLLAKTIGCLRCGGAFRFIRNEFDFYKRFGLPLPRLCPSCRYAERLKNRNPMKLQKRKCMCTGLQSAKSQTQIVYENTTRHFHGAEPCPNEFETAYAPERPEIVYCEECYNQEVA